MYQHVRRWCRASIQNIFISYKKCVCTWLRSGFPIGLCSRLDVRVADKAYIMLNKTIYLHLDIFVRFILN